MVVADQCDDLHVDVERVAEASAHVVGHDVADDLADVFGALADPTRVRLISALARMELCVGELAATVGMTMSAVSHQLRMLRRLRLIRSRREGRHVYYSLDDQHILMMFTCGLEHLEHE